MLRALCVRVAWLDATLRILAAHGIGWALWNFRGPFGLADTAPGAGSQDGSRPTDVDPEILAVLHAH